MTQSSFAIWKFHYIEGHYEYFIPMEFEHTKYDDGKKVFDIYYNIDKEIATIIDGNAHIEVKFDDLKTYFERNCYLKERNPDTCNKCAYNY